MPHTSQSKPCVLLVEDDDAVRRSLQLLLQSRGYRVRAYPSAIGLADDPAARDCACIVADLMLPQTDAIQLLRQLKARDWNGRSILISGHLDTRWEAQARSAGYDAILSKPISDSVLVRTIVALLPNQPAEA